MEEVELTTYTTWDEARVLWVKAEQRSISAYPSIKLPKSRKRQADIAGPSPELSAAVEPPVEPQLDFWGFPKDVPGVRSFRRGWKPRLVQKGRATDQPACRPLPEMRESQQSTGLAFGLALPLWQTAVAGGFACVAHRTVAASVADLMGCPTRKPAIQELARQAVPTVARNAAKFSAGFPFGAICCSLYVLSLAVDWARAACNAAFIDGPINQQNSENAFEPRSTFCISPQQAQGRRPRTIWTQ